MRSRLEADFAARLDFLTYRWIYEPRCFANETGQYLPDFLITGYDEPYSPDLGPPTSMHPAAGTYIEVKPAALLLEGSDRTKTLYGILDQMAIIWDSEPDAALSLVGWEYGAKEPSARFDCDPCQWWSPAAGQSWQPAAYSQRVKARFDRAHRLEAS